MANANGTINLAAKYEKKLDERFAIQSKTNDAAGKAFDFNGVDSITVLSADRMEAVDYTRTGQNRFGTIYELGDSKQVLQLAKDRGLTFSIDEGNREEQFNVKQANARLKDHWDGVVTPEVDVYRLASWAAGRGLSTGKTILQNATPAALDSTNIVQAIFNAGAAMSDNLVPADGRTLWISELDYVKFQLADVVVGGTQLNAEAIRKGYRGTIDNMRVVTVPSIYMPAKVGFLIKHKSATVDPLKLKYLRIHHNPMGINGDVVEIRWRYDAFVLDQKCKGVYAYKTSA